LFTDDRHWGTVLHRPLLVQRPLLKGPGKAGGQSLLRQLRANLPPWVACRLFDGIRLAARRPGAEYGFRYYPMRFYEHSLASVGAIADFVEAIHTGRPPLCTVDEAARTVVACLAAVESYRTRQPIRLAAFEPAGDAVVS
jgi:hypothetical protein